MELICSEELIHIHLMDNLTAGEPVLTVVPTITRVVEAVVITAVEVDMEINGSVDKVRELMEHQTISLNKKITILLKIHKASLIKLHSKKICKAQCKMCSKLSI